MNLSPTVSPDGKMVAFFARRGLFEIELFVADAQTGRAIKKLAGPTSDSHFDAISFISTSGAWSPDNAKFAFIAQARGQPRDRHPRREVERRRAAHPRAGRRLDTARRMVARRTDASRSPAWPAASAISTCSTSPPARCVSSRTTGTPTSSRRGRRTASTIAFSTDRGADDRLRRRWCSRRCSSRRSTWRAAG